MIAVAILGVSMITIMRAFSLCLKSVGRSSFDTRAALVAGAKLDQLDFYSRNAGTKPEMAGTDNGIRWSCAEPAGNDGISRVACTINPETGDGARFQTYLR